MTNSVNKIEFSNYGSLEIVSGTCIHSFPVHIHQSLCIGIISSGQANFIISSQKAILSKGDNYIIPPYMPHTLSSINNKIFSYSVCCFKNFRLPLLTEDYISKALGIIKTEPAQFSLEFLANAVHISKFHLERKFKEQVGITPYQYYLNEKIKKIRQGLLSHKSLSDLTFDLGFSDESHLCNTFKKHVGISPLQYASSYKTIKEAQE